MLMALLLMMQAAPPQKTAPVLEFPTAGLDDSAAYEGYRARIYRDSRGNSVEIYIDGKTGRVVHLWADGLNESIGFTARGGEGAAVAFGEKQATVGRTGARRWLRYQLTLPAGQTIRIGQILLGSMRVERDFGYAGRVRDSIGAPTFVPDEFVALAAKLGAEYEQRLTPALTFSKDTLGWRALATQSSLDGKNHLRLTISGIDRRSQAALDGRVLTITSIGPRPARLVVEIATDGGALDPLSRRQIFSSAFRRFAD